MPSFEEARQLILERVKLTDVEQVPLLTALNRVVARDVLAEWDLPNYDNSAMDGYAVRVEDCSQGGSMSVAGAIMANQWRHEPVPLNFALKIMTGAPVPSDCNAVVPFEDLLTEKPDLVVVPSGIRKGQHIRFQGEDIRKGEAVVTAGTVVRPAEISMLAACGITALPVYRRIRVAILSTGDELVEQGEGVAMGRIINSNSPAIAAAVIAAGAEPVLLGIARDTTESLREKISTGLEADVLVTTAGVSAGERDLVREVLSELGVVAGFWKVDVKPGGPTAFGMKGAVPVFSLPGNPVSSLLTFEEFVRPALLKMMGHIRVCRHLFRGVLDEDMNKKRGKMQLARVKVAKDGYCYRLSSAGNQQTGVQRTLIHCDAIAVLPADQTHFSAGDEVCFHFLHDSDLLESAG